jgi:hypothetical protein
MDGQHGTFPGQSKDHVVDVSGDVVKIRPAFPGAPDIGQHAPRCHLGISRLGCSHQDCLFEDGSQLLKDPFNAKKTSGLAEQQANGSQRRFHNFGSLALYNQFWSLFRMNFEMNQ